MIQMLEQTFDGLGAARRILAHLVAHGRLNEALSKSPDLEMEVCRIIMEQAERQSLFHKTQMAKLECVVADLHYELFQRKLEYAENERALSAAWKTTASDKTEDNR